MDVPSEWRDRRERPPGGERADERQASNGRHHHGALGRYEDSGNKPQVVTRAAGEPVNAHIIHPGELMAATTLEPGAVGGCCRCLVNATTRCRTVSHAAGERPLCDDAADRADP